MFVNLNAMRCSSMRTQEWIEIEGWRVRPRYETDYLWSHAALKLLSELRKERLGVISGAAVAQWHLNTELALDLNKRGIHALIGTSCSCGLGADFEPIDGNKLPTRAQRERIVMSLAGHFDHIDRIPAGQFVRGTLKLPKRSYWIQPPGELAATTWHCVDCGDLEEAIANVESGIGWLAPKGEFHSLHVNVHGFDEVEWRSAQRSELEFWSQIRQQHANLNC
jgi:hypothetical protein